MSTDPRPANLEAIMSVMANLTSLIDAAAGYRQTAVTHGFTPEAAEHMAVDLHERMLGMVFSQIKAAK